MAMMLRREGGGFNAMTLGDATLTVTVGLTI